jgi:hypothetical protein
VTASPGKITVTGPGVEREYDGKITTAVALSAAQGFAMQAEAGSTFYVRDRDGTTAYRVERGEGSAVTYVYPEGES